MSLPRYCINLSELSDYLKNWVNKPKQFICPYGTQRSKGFRVISKNDLQPQVKSFVVEIPYEEYVITGMNISIPTMNDNFDNINERGMDYFNFIVNGEYLFDTVYIKDIDQYKNFRRPFRVTQRMIDDGLTMEIEYHNNTKTTILDKDGSEIEVYKHLEVWFNIDYMAMPKLTEFKIHYIDENENEIIPSSLRKFSEGIHRIESINIEGYYVVGKYCQLINVTYDENNVFPIDIMFQYVKM